MEQFPALYGSWICLPVIQMFGSSYTDCMRFLPETSTPEDPRFQDGVQTMTYLTSRGADGVNSLVDASGNETMEADAVSVFESFTVDLMGAWSGISQAGLALATAVLVWAF